MPNGRDTLVIGGGIIGMSIAYGLAKSGEKVTVLDEGDDAFRAARGNFGLVWVQGKGQNCLDYARWTLEAAALWPDFCSQLQDDTGVDVELSQNGGLVMCLSEPELAARAKVLASIQSTIGQAYPFEVHDLAELRRRCQLVGPEVVGATYCPLDGHVSPLRLLRALMQGCQASGGRISSGSAVDAIDKRDGAFHVMAGGIEYVGGRVVLCAGLGNARLAPMVGLHAPVKPVRGQVLVSERAVPFLDVPSLHVRQTGEGVVQIGDSKEEVGFDDGTTLEQLSRIADRAIRCFPVLANVNLVRTWGALRVMTDDGLPLYQESMRDPGAFLVTCHSGITLAPAHAGPLVGWLQGAAPPSHFRSFKAERFSV